MLLCLCGVGDKTHPILGLSTVQTSVTCSLLHRSKHRAWPSFCLCFALHWGGRMVSHCKWGCAADSKNKMQCWLLCFLNHKSATVVHDSNHTELLSYKFIKIFFNIINTSISILFVFCGISPQLMQVYRSCVCICVFWACVCVCV